MIKTEDRISFIPIAEIDWIEAREKNSCVHAGKREHTVREGLYKLQTDLDPRLFVRVHRSAIVRIDRIRELHRWFHGNYRILIGDGTSLILSRRCRKNLSRALGRPL
jgi:two-component system, LytTR family, response regulator